MTERPPMPHDPDDQNEQLATRLRYLASLYPYPTTPDIAGKVRRQISQPSRPARRLARVAVALALVGVIVGTLLVVPEARAALVQLLRLGAVTIVVGDVTPTGSALVPSPARTQASRGDQPIPSALDLPGETTFDEAQERLGIPLPLPSYPADLGPPDRVFLLDVTPPMASLVWVDPQEDATVRMSLHVVSSRANAYKYDAERVVETRVNDRLAYWFEEPHQFVYFAENGPEAGIVRLLDQNVLLWEANGFTYRLETDLSLAEAVRVAESIPG